jgi:hypothetical protein
MTPAPKEGELELTLFRSGASSFCRVGSNSRHGSRNLVGGLDNVLTEGLPMHAAAGVWVSPRTFIYLYIYVFFIRWQPRINHTFCCHQLSSQSTIINIVLSYIISIIE